MSKNMPLIVGFVEVDKLIEIGYLTQWSTYKVFQAVRNKDLEYQQAYYIQHGATLTEALDIFESKRARFAVVRQYPKEVGMVSKAAVTCALDPRVNQPKASIKGTAEPDRNHQLI